jgi:hypothetical protein
MSASHSTIDDAILQIDTLKRILKKSTSLQVRANQEKSIIKATALAWFNNARPQIEGNFTNENLSPIDNLYNELLVASEHATIRSEYLDKTKAIRNVLVNLRSQSILNPLANTKATNSSDLPPKFSLLITDVKMQKILLRRWAECLDCISAGAPLAATVMMGGLLEAILLARVNHETNKALVFKAAVAPKDKNTGKTLPLKEWGLKNYIDVAHELGWISQSAKDVSEVLRDYRNYVHPYKELSHGIMLGKEDAPVLWEVSKSITAQILKSI